MVASRGNNNRVPASNNAQSRFNSEAEDYDNLRKAQQRAQQQQAAMRHQQQAQQQQQYQRQQRAYQQQYQQSRDYSYQSDEQYQSQYQQQAATARNANSSRNDYPSKQEKNQAAAERKVINVLKAALREPVVLISVVLLLVLFIFLRPFYVPSASMNPTLMEGDKILSVAQYFANGHTYERGDVVCFTAPSGDVYVKRVIGVGGDHIQISGEKVYVNGELSQWQGTGGVMSSVDVTLADDEYWVMGDNRGNSEDSRFIGPVSADNMISKVYCIYYPFDRATLL